MLSVLRRVAIVGLSLGAMASVPTARSHLDPGPARYRVHRPRSPRAQWRVSTPCGSGSSGISPCTSNTTVTPGQHVELTITIFNDNSSDQDYAISCDVGGIVMDCSVSDFLVSIPASSQHAFTLAYTAGQAGGTGFARVHVGATLDGDIEGTFNITVPSPSVAVSPKGQSAVATPSALNAQSFTVTNTSLLNLSYTLRPLCSGGAMSCAVAGATNPVTIAAGASQSVAVSYISAAAPDTGSVRLIATYSGPFGTAADTGSVGVTVGSGVEVTADGDHWVVQSGATGGVVFYVRNRTHVSTTYAVTATCTNTSGTLFPASGCQVLGSTLTVPADTITGIIVYWTGAAGADGTTGRILVRATQTSPTSSATDTGWVTLVAHPLHQDTARIDVASVNPGPTVARDLCLTAAVGDDAAWECGALRIAHPLRTIRTMNRTRTPTLLYNSALAQPRPVVQANVALGDSTLYPDTVFAVLKINGVVKDSVKVPKAGFWPGKPQRIALTYSALTDSTGVYPYTVTVTLKYNAGSVLKSSTAAGTLILVNRASSAFGAGWWLAGLEHLYFPSADTTTRLWVGGDGSARLYTKVATNTWAAPNVDAPDTLKWDGTKYVRYLRHELHGLQVQFDATGRHIATVNRLGHTTTFSYSATSPALLTTITVPPAAAAKTYTFWYTSGKLDSVSNPGPGPNGASEGRRRTRVVMASGRVTAVQDCASAAPVCTPNDTASVTFDYASGTNLITTRTNRLRVPTIYHYDALTHLTQSSLTVSPTQTIVLRLRNPDSLARPTLASAVAESVDSAYVRIDGARTDVRDVQAYWVDRLGQPTKIVNALGDSTLLARTDGRWPAAVTYARYPNGRAMVATYDGRGNVLTTVDSGTVVNDTVAVTRYAWDTTWDFATTVVPPMGDSIVMAYDPSLGNRLWQQDARGPSSRITFAYNSLGQLRAIKPPLSPADSLTYDTTGLGNLSRAVHAIGSPSNPKYVATAYHLDSLGRASTEISPIDTLGAYADTTASTYDAFDRATLVTHRGPKLYYPRRWPPFPNTDSTMAEALIVRNTYDAEGNLTAVARIADPDINAIDTIKTEWRYDAANRRILEIAPDNTPTHHVVDSTVYDAAGNITQQFTRRLMADAPGQALVQTYDALNRLVRRDIPAVAYAQETYGAWPWGFPLYHPFGGSGLPIPASKELYAYDAMGNMTAADNEAAQIRRSYNPNGTLAADTLIVFAYSSTAMPAGSNHVYGLRYGYDRDGRRTKLIHPRNIAPRPTGSTTPLDSVAYAYTNAGQLATVRNVVGDIYAYFYDDEGRLDSLAYPGGLSEKWTYTADGLIRRRLERAANSFVGTSGVRGFADGTIHDDTLYYDARGKIIEARALGDSSSAAYTALGTLAYSYSVNRALPTDFTEERYVADALGNYRRTRHLTTPGGALTPVMDSTLSHYQAGTGRLVSRYGSAAFDGQVYTDHGYVDTTVYDAGGSRIQGGSGAVQSQAVLYERTRQYYAADGRLRVVDRRTCVLPNNATACSETAEPGVDHRGAFEEYRYDALGRRVLIRSLVDSACFYQYCPHTLQRTVWDGDAILYEIRYRGGDGSLGSEPDTVTIADTVGVLPYGRVAYTYGLGVDRPLDVIRMGFAPASYPNPIVVIPHRDWRGRAELGSYDDGSAHRCTDYTNIAKCINITWPAPYRYVNSQSKMNGLIGFQTWFGSLIDENRDASGNLYKRNRYYDPQTAQFTQEDPIGLAGGLNLYGYAAGDPVNYSDPFGLCPVCVVVYVGVELAEVAEEAYTIYQGARIAGALLKEADEGNPADARTEPTLPDKEIASEGGVTIEHNYRSGDHGPAHLHVTGGGRETKIGQNGKPLKGEPELTPQQQRAVNNNKAAIRRAVGKIGRWLDYQEKKGEW